MFERFTDRARHVVVHAQDEAREWKHDYIGTEHLLLGLYAAPESVAARALLDAGLTRDRVRSSVESLVGRGVKTPGGHIPFTPRAKKVLELALREALQIGHNYIGTEHILLALIREGEGVAVHTMTEHGVDPDRLRKLVLGMLEGSRIEPATDPGFTRSGALDDVLAAARALAGGAAVGTHHLLEALVNAENSMAARALSQLGVRPDAVADEVDSLDLADTTDATPEETAARRMELRVDGDEVHLVLRDTRTLELAKAVIEGHGGPLTAAGPLAGAFVPLWQACDQLLRSLHQAALVDECDDLDDASTLVRRILHGRLRRRRR